MRPLILTLVCAASAARAAPFSESQLDALLASSPRTQRPIDSIAELVPLLPDELRENFTFVHTSRSPFRGSITPDRPRVILFTQDASFIATFIGDEHAPGHDVLETMSFDPRSARFVLRARLLPAALRAGTQPRSSASCAACHGADPRPIFDAYPLWPGFYGSAQDTFPAALESSRRELRDYLHFLSTAAREGVYAGLRWVLGSPVSPYLDPRRYVDGKTRSPATELYYQPNARLGMALTELNRKRLFRKLAASENFAEQAPALTAELLVCDEDAAPLAEEAAVLRLLRKEDAARLTRLGDNRSLTQRRRFAMQELGDVRNIAQLVHLAARTGVDRSDWSMALQPGSLAFYDGLLSGIAGGRSYYLKEDLLFELLGHLAGRDPRLAPYFQPRATLAELGYPFGNKLDLDQARASCALLRQAAKGSPRSPRRTQRVITR